jgi:hypothetical protein
MKGVTLSKEIYIEQITDVLGGSVEHIPPLESQRKLKHK